MREGYGEVMLWEVGVGVGMEAGDGQSVGGEEEAVRMLRRVGWRDAFGVGGGIEESGGGGGQGMLQSLYF